MAEITTAASIAEIATAKRPGALSFRARPWVLAVPAVLVVVFAVAYPVSLMVARSFTDKDGGEGAYAWVFNNPVYVEIIIRTFWTAILTTAICLLLGYPFAYLMTVTSKRRSQILLAIVVLPLVVSTLVRTFAWLVLLQPNGLVAKVLPFGLGSNLLGTWTAVEIGIVQVLLPFMILPLYSTMRGIDRKLIEAAQGLGRGPSWP